MKDTILLALKDEEDIRALTEHLGSSTFELPVARDGASAIEAAVNDPPSLIVADIELPVVDGVRVFNILRRSRHTSKVPFLFISDTAADLKGFRAETDTFLTRPFNPEEASGRIRQVLLHNPGGPKGVIDMRATLDQIGSGAQIDATLELRPVELSVLAGLLPRVQRAPSSRPPVHRLFRF